MELKNLNDTFKRDLSNGKLIEYKHLAILQKIFPDTVSIDGYCKEWDIFIPSLDIGIEIKSDKMSQTTGNIVVEVEFNGKPSALSTTKSSWWVFDTGKEHMVVHVDRLRELVKQFNPVSFIGKGDSKSKKAYLIPIDMVRDIKNNWYDEV